MRLMVSGAPIAWTMSGTPRCIWCMQCVTTHPSMWVILSARVPVFRAPCPRDTLDCPWRKEQTMTHRERWRSVYNSLQLRETTREPTRATFYHQAPALHRQRACWRRSLWNAVRSRSSAGSLAKFAPIERATHRATPRTSRNHQSKLATDLPRQAPHLLHSDSTILLRDARPSSPSSPSSCTGE